MCKIAAKFESQIELPLEACSVIVKGKAVHLFPDVLKILKELGGASEKHREACIGMCITVVLNEYATRKAIRRCRGCISTLLNVDRKSTMDALVKALVNQRGAL